MNKSTELNKKNTLKSYYNIFKTQNVYYNQ